MTSQELVDRITGYRWFRDRKIQIDEGEVLVAANTAQDDILADLHFFDDLGYLATVSGQEQYTFTRGTITGATNLSPITISETAHKYHTGDRVTIAGCVGNTAANGTFIVTYVGADSYSLDGSTGNGAWTSGGYSYHCLMGAERLASDLMNTTTFKRVVARRYEQLQQIRSSMIAGNPQWVYQLTKPNSGLTLGFHGIPDAVSVFEFRYYKIPLPHERISLTVDPWVEEEQLMFYGTLFFTLDMLKSSSDEVVERKAAMLWQQFNQVKEGEKILWAKKKYVNDINAGLRF
jgi:hypothetical protein